MFERFTDKARRAVVLAQDEARELGHDHVGTEHLVLGMLRDGGGVAASALTSLGITREAVRDAVAATAQGTPAAGGRIPFTAGAKRSLELALREALQLGFDYIGTEHILLGVIGEGDGVGAQILKEHAADLLPVRVAVLDLLQAAGPARSGRWLRRRVRAVAGSGEAPEPAMEGDQATTPAADASLGEAARLASGAAVGSHHLMLAALSDPNAAAARALSALGVDLEQARQALRTAEVTGTSDELPEDAGRRQMLIRVTDDKVTIDATDPVIVDLGRAAVEALGDQADPPSTIRGDQPASESLSDLWLALRDSLDLIRGRAAQPANPEDETKPSEPGSDVA